MYFPPYNQLISAANRILSQQKSEPSITVPKKLFDFLLQAALVTAEFDEESYLNRNQDLRAGLGNGNSLTAHQHFLGYGYFEGRNGGTVEVDETWYLETYPDVAAAVKSGKVKSAKEHFEIAGASEGRSPSKFYVEVARQWKSLLMPAG